MGGSVRVWWQGKNNNQRNMIEAGFGLLRMGALLIITRRDERKTVPVWWEILGLNPVSNLVRCSSKLI